MWCCGSADIENVLRNVGLDGSALRGETKQMQHGIIMRKNGPVRHYLILASPSDGGSELLATQYNRVSPKDFQTLSTAILASCPTTNSGSKARVSRLADFVTEAHVAELRPHFARVYVGAASAAVPSTPSELVLTLQALERQGKITAPLGELDGDSDEEVSDAERGGEGSGGGDSNGEAQFEIPEAAGVAMPDAATVPTQLAPFTETRTVQVTSGADRSTVRSQMLERGGELYLVLNNNTDGGEDRPLKYQRRTREAHSLGRLPSFDEASSQMSSSLSAFNLDRMASKSLRVITGSVLGLFSLEETAQGLGQSFGLGMENRNLRAQLKVACGMGMMMTTDWVPPSATLPASPNPLS